MLEARGVCGVVLSCLVATVASPACSGKSEHPARIDPGGNNRKDASLPGRTGGGSGSGGSADASVEGGGGALEGGSGGSALNCGNIVCSGPGDCIQPEGGTPRCVCDEGYVEVGEGAQRECVVDESCIDIKFLEDVCRVQANGAPAVGLYFAVDFCSGGAVLPDKLDELGLTFKILEDDVDITQNAESFADVIDRDVESYVTVALDVSESVIDDPDLLQNVIRELRDFISALEPAAGQATVGMQLLVFGRQVGELVPFTTNLKDIDAALETLEADPDGSLAGKVDVRGTALNPVVNRGIRDTERMQRLRQGVTEGGVLSTGTLVVITDGIDESGVPLDTDLIDRTLVNLISVGISNDVTQESLGRIGRDGSFLAPTPEARAETFSEIAKRVDEYPDRSYLLAYCSPATAGEKSVKVELSGGTVNLKKTASCRFNAGIFGDDPKDQCTEDLIRNPCENRSCGGLFGCGACADDECCAQGHCVGPESAANCNGQDELCLPNETAQCENDGCVTKSGEGGPCETDTDCLSGSTCVDTGIAADAGPNKECRAIALPEDAECTEAAQCESLNCVDRSPGSSDTTKQCDKPARYGDFCDTADIKAICPVGTSCSNEGPNQTQRCELRRTYGCQVDKDCFSGNCLGSACITDGTCHYGWDRFMNF